MKGLLISETFCVDFGRLVRNLGTKVGMCSVLQPTLRSEDVYVWFLPAKGNTDLSASIVTALVNRIFRPLQVDKIVSHTVHKMRLSLYGHDFVIKG